MKILLLLFVSVPAMSSQMSFTYEPYGEGPTQACIHQVVSAQNPMDWKVKCPMGSSATREFTAHVVVSKYVRAAEPRVSYEVLYWVNGEGASTLYNFKNDGELMSISSGQSVDGGTAGLRLNLILK
jgi:hypothetical protein